jgi:hypothetical protein
MTNLTNNEINILKMMNDNHDHNGATFHYDIKPLIGSIGLTGKEARGVISSLIKKGHVVAWEDAIEAQTGVVNGKIQTVYHTCFFTRHIIEEGCYEGDETWEEFKKKN